MYSYWEKQFWFENYDFVIIGSGIVGLTTALQLRKLYPSTSIGIFERTAIPTGASTKNAGFACYGTVGEILDDLTHISEDDIIDTIKMRWQGLQLIQKIVVPKKVSWNNCGGYEVFRTKESYEKCEAGINEVNRLLEASTGISNTIKPISLGTASLLHNRCLYNKNEAQLNPGLLIKNLIKLSLSKGIYIHNGIELTSYKSDSAGVELSLGEIGLQCHTKRLIFTNNAFAHKFFPKEDIVPARNQVLISDPIEDMPWKGTYHLDRGYIYFRDVGNRLLIGGARNIDSQTELTDKIGQNHKVISHLLEFSKSYLGVDKFSPINQWSGIIATGKSKKPIIDKLDNHVYGAVRLGGMGVATGAAVGAKLTSLISSEI